MRPLRHWSFVQVLAASGAWVILGLALLVGWGYLQRYFSMPPADAGGVGELTVEVGAVKLAGLVGPPRVLLMRCPPSQRSSIA
jgi:hypothetical protein